MIITQGHIYLRRGWCVRDNPVIVIPIAGDQARSIQSTDIVPWSGHQMHIAGILSGGDDVGVLGIAAVPSAIGSNDTVVVRLIARGAQ